MTMISCKITTAFLLLLTAPRTIAEDHSKLKLRNSETTSFLSHIYGYFQEEPTVTPAISLEEFANVDSSLFKWVNATEIQPGRATCGFLKAPLGALPDVVYPKVKVYVCVRFAKNQPAPRGNLAVHCGGPGSLSSCVYDFDQDLGTDNVDNYNIIGIDQRGMGRSLPSFASTDCAITTYDPELATLAAVQLDQQETIRAGAKVFKDRSLGCWNRPEFKLTVKKQGVKKTYHFLEYSGTRQLAEDIERVRQLFGEDKLSIYGLSYGTKVMGLYATMFPSSINLMVLDSNLDPGVDIEQWATDSARSKNQRMEYFISACDRNPGLCPVSNMRRCFSAMNDMIKANVKDLGDFVKELLATLSGTPAGPGDMPASEIIVFMIQGLYGSVDKAPSMCAAAEAGDYNAFKEALAPPSMYDSFIQDDNTTSLDLNTLSTPTYGTDDWPFESYATLDTQGRAALLTLVAQDYIFGAYNEDDYVDFLFELNKRYSGIGTQSPIGQAYWWYSATYQAPVITPTPPIGNSWLTGIVAGQLYDPQTAYIWTQNMRENFPSTHLLTSRSVNHGMLMAKETTLQNSDCQRHVKTYFTTGVINFVDGTVCESDPVEYSCTIEQIATSQQCI